MKDLKGKDRLIVALDVPTVRDAAELVSKLDNISFVKIGLELFLTGVMSGDMRWLLEKLKAKQIFVDLKVPGDIDKTLAKVIELCITFNVKFLTLSAYVQRATIQSARQARGARENPKLLTVPYLSSMDSSDLRDMALDEDIDAYISRQAEAAINAGCDGLIASGDAIQLLRKLHPQPTIIVSPGIRPTWAPADGDHKRFTTPGDAIKKGADYLVVGRPIRDDSDPRQAAQLIINEIDAALEEIPNQSAASGFLSKVG